MVRHLTAQPWHNHCDTRPSQVTWPIADHHDDPPMTHAWPARSPSPRRLPPTPSSMRGRRRTLRAAGRCSLRPTAAPAVYVPLPPHSRHPRLPPFTTTRPTPVPPRFGPHHHVPTRPHARTAPHRLLAFPMLRPHPRHSHLPHRRTGTPHNVPQAPGSPHVSHDICQVAFAMVFPAHTHASRCVLTHPMSALTPTLQASFSHTHPCPSSVPTVALH